MADTAPLLTRPPDGFGFKPKCPYPVCTMNARTPICVIPLGGRIMNNGVIQVNKHYYGDPDGAHEPWASGVHDPVMAHRIVTTGRHDRHGRVIMYVSAFFIDQFSQAELFINVWRSYPGVHDRGILMCTFTTVGLMGKCLCGKCQRPWLDLGWCCPWLVEVPAPAEPEPEA